MVDITLKQINSAKSVKSTNILYISCWSDLEEESCLQIKLLQLLF